MVSVRPVEGSRFRILLADDNSRGNIARKTLLEEQGYEVETAANGEEAWDMFLRTPFDLVVTDFKMPKMNGLELVAKIRAQNCGTAIVLLSGFVRLLGLDEKNTGADVVLDKCHKEEEHLVRTVRQLLNGKPRRKSVASQTGRMRVSVARSG